MSLRHFLTTEVGRGQSELSGVTLPAVNPVQVVHAGSRPLKHPATTEAHGLLGFFFAQKQINKR